MGTPVVIELCAGVEVMAFSSGHGLCASIVVDEGSIDGHSFNWVRSSSAFLISSWSLRFWFLSFLSSRMALTDYSGGVLEVSFAVNSPAASEDVRFGLAFFGRALVFS